MYIDGHIYFVTTKTYNNFPYFKNEIFCELFIMELMFCQKLFGFEIYAYKINPDHIHLLLCPNNAYNYSKIMQFVKRHFTRNCNILIGTEEYSPKGDNGHCRLYKEMPPTGGLKSIEILVREFDHKVFQLKEQFFAKYGLAIDIPRFKWQKSFHYHCITSKIDLANHIQYILNQSAKHGLPENKYCFVDNKLIIRKWLSKGNLRECRFYPNSYVNQYRGVLNTE
jgi:REP element-mobilizing transposase RayT